MNELKPLYYKCFMEIEFLTNERRKSRDEILSDRGMSVSTDPCILESCVTVPSVLLITLNSCVTRLSVEMLRLRNQLSRLWLELLHRERPGE